MPIFSSIHAQIRFRIQIIYTPCHQMHAIHFIYIKKKQIKTDAKAGQKLTKERTYTARFKQLIDSGEINGGSKDELRRRQWKRTIFILDTCSVEDAGIDGAILDVNLNGQANEAHGGKEQGLAERGRASLILRKLPVSATHIPVSESERAGSNGGVRLCENKKKRSSCRNKI